MYESKNGYWDDEITNEEVEEEVEEYARHIDTYIFPDKEKINSILIYYNRKLNGSFVKYLKTQCIEFFDMFTAYKNMKLEENELTNVFVYPDIKTFNACLGNTTTKIERDILMGLRPNTIQSAYIVSDDNGDIHVVLPRSRGSEIYDAYFTEIMALVLANYDKEYAKNILGAKKKVVEFIKKREIKKLQKEQKKAEEAERKKQEEERLQKKLEEEEERKRQEEEEQERLEEEAEKERLEQEMLDEAKLQKELEEAETEAERLEILEAEESIEDIDLNEDMQTLEAKVEDSENMDSEKFAKFMQAFLLFRAAKFHKPQYMGAYAEYCKTHKLLTLGKINKANIQNWVDQCTLALQVEYTINLYGHKRFLKYCFAACDKNFESKDLYKTIFGEDKLRFENALKEYCKLATRSVAPTLKLAKKIKDKIKNVEEAIEDVKEEMAGKDTEKHGIEEKYSVFEAEKKEPATRPSISIFEGANEHSIGGEVDTTTPISIGLIENVVESKLDTADSISIKPLNAKKINPIWMALFNLREDGVVIPESNEYGWFINPEQRTKII